MPFCSNDLSVLNNVYTFKTKPAGEIDIKRDDFGAKFFFYQQAHFDKSLDMDIFCFLYYEKVLLYLEIF